MCVLMPSHFNVGDTIGQFDVEAVRRVLVGVFK